VKDKFGRGDHKGIMNFVRIITLVRENFAFKCLMFLFYMQKVSGSHLCRQAGSAE
jgi:hypothetical protein